jgi:CheY-like chemotaxis protein
MSNRPQHTILVVEDDPDISDTLRDVLENEGHRVVNAANGREGLASLEEIGRPSLILLDLMMPVMSGGEFLTALRSDAECATIPVVVVSAWPQEASNLSKEIQGFIKKPVSLQDLLAVTREWCGPEGPPVFPE